MSIFWIYNFCVSISSGSSIATAPTNQRSVLQIASALGVEIDEDTSLICC